MAVMITPMDNAPVATMPIAVSPPVLDRWDQNMIRQAAITTIGIETAITGSPSATARDVDAKPTSPSPWPIREYCFNTRITPSSAAQREIITPAAIALCTNG